jgi:hypothetical protein
MVSKTKSKPKKDEGKKKDDGKKQKFESYETKYTPAQRKKIEESREDKRKPSKDNERKAKIIGQNFRQLMKLLEGPT